MTGIPTKFAIVDRVLPRIGPIGDQERRFVYLGAIGAALGDFLPSGTGGPRSPYLNVWWPVLEAFAGTTPTDGIAYCLHTLWTRMQRLKEILAREDKLALIAMIDDLRELETVGRDLSAAGKRLEARPLEFFTDVRNAAPFTASRSKVPPSSSWPVRSTLHGSHPGRFLRALRERSAAGGEAVKAFAVGATIGYASDLCGNPYINSVVNAPYRNHWWRHRWISNHVDTWVWGYYQLIAGGTGPSFSAFTPSPPYAAWPDVREAKLHERLGFDLDATAMLTAIRTGGPLGSPLPQEIVDAWLGAYRDTYGTPAAGSGIDSAGLQGAASLAWLVLWLQTAGQAIPCVPLTGIVYPDASTRPEWMGPTGKVDVDGQTMQPQTPSPDLDPDVPQLASAIFVGLVAAFQLLAGVVLAGVQNLIIAIVLAIDAATDPDWDKLRVHVGWVLVFLSGQIKRLHDLMVLSGLGFPYTEQLSHNPLALGAGIRAPHSAAVVTVRSRVDDGDYPQRSWLALASDWPRTPTGSVELPAMAAYPTSFSTWPSHFVDGLRPGLGTQENPVVPWPGGRAVTHPGAFASRVALLNTSRPPAFLFGNAVDVAVHLTQLAPNTPLLDWDLDADPGIGMPTWVLPSPGAPRSDSILEP